MSNRNGYQANEILDVVDDADRVIGQASRAEVHDKGWFHRAVHVFLFNSRGHIYVQRRSIWKDRYPLKIDSSAAGHLDSGESYWDAAKRELQEELDIIADITCLMKVTACAETDNEHVVLFKAQTDEIPIPNTDEICEGEFLCPLELSELITKNPMDLVPAFILLWKLYTKADIHESCHSESFRSRRPCGWGDSG